MVRSPSNGRTSWRTQSSARSRRHSGRRWSPSMSNPHEHLRKSSPTLPCSSPSLAWRELPETMTRPTRSLQHEYERYVEQEIEAYKESVPRSVLLGIGDEAVASLARQAQFTLTELIVWEEVDKIIAKRLRLPSATTWRRRRLKVIEELRRPERWGMTASHPLVRGVAEAASTGTALVAGSVDESPALYLAANGCRVTAIDDEPDAVDRVIHAALRAGLTERI